VLERVLAMSMDLPPNNVKAATPTLVQLVGQRGGTLEVALARAVTEPWPKLECALTVIPEKGRVRVKLWGRYNATWGTVQLNGDHTLHLAPVLLLVEKAYNIEPGTNFKLAFHQVTNLKAG